MREISRVDSRRIHEENKRDFLDNLNSEEEVSVIQGRFVYPRNTLVFFPNSRVSCRLDYALYCCGNLAEVNNIFEVDERTGKYTGYYRKNGRQKIADQFGRPTAFTYRGNTVDERPYVDRAFFYPDYGFFTGNECSIDLINGNQAQLRSRRNAKIEDDKTPPHFVHIPNLPYLYQRQLIDADDMFHPSVLSFRVNSLGTRQLKMDFDPLEVTWGLGQTLKACGGDTTILGQKVDVPGAFVGKFAESLSNIGLDVRASDILDPYVRGLEAKGLKARKCLAERLPKVPDGKLASVTFELYPLAGSPSFNIAMQREILMSEFGMIFVQERDSSLPDYSKMFKRDYNDYHPEVDAYSRFAQVYGLGVNVVDTAMLRFIGLSRLASEQKQQMKRDLILTYQLARAVGRGEFNGKEMENTGIDVHNCRVVELPVSNSELADKSNSTKEEVVESLTRIGALYYGLTLESMKLTDEMDKENGGLLTKLVLKKEE